MLATIEHEPILGPFPARCKDRAMLPPLAGALLDEPLRDGVPVVAAVAAELEAGHPAGASLGANPALGDGETLSDLAGIEEALGQCARLRSACMTSTTSLGRQT
jgi:hypothetical protein